MDLFHPFFVFSLFGKKIPISVLTLFGLIGNVLFFGRVLIQWIASERAKKSVVPIAFWWTSLAATLVMIVYSLARHDKLGVYDPNMPMFIGYSVTVIPYLRNLRIHYSPNRPPRTGLQIILPMLLIISAAVVGLALVMPKPNWPLFLFGLAGNAVNGSRFLIAWVKSESARKSVLPLSFWYVSAAGSLMLLVYALMLGDLVYILGFIFNTIPQVRNIILLQKEGRAAAAD